MVVVVNLVLIARGKGGRRCGGRTCAAQHNGAGLGLGDAGEVDEAVLPDGDLLDELTLPQLGLLRMVEGAGDVPACRATDRPPREGVHGSHRCFRRPRHKKY